MLHEELKFSGYPVFFKSATGQRTFHYCAVSLWNELPENMKCKKSYIHPVNNYYANVNICDISKSIETVTMKLQQHKLYRLFDIFSNFEVN